MNNEFNMAVSQSLNSKNVYYVLLPELETSENLTAELATIRKRFFESGNKKQAIKVKDQYMGFSSVAKGVITSKSLNYKKTVKKIRIEECFYINNNFVVLRRDLNGFMSGKIYFDKFMKWIKTEYYTSNESIIASHTIKPCHESSGIDVFVYDVNKQTNVSTKYLPINCDVSTDIKNRVEEKFGISKVYSYLANGTNIYYESGVYEKVMDMLQNRPINELESITFENSEEAETFVKDDVEINEEDLTLEVMSDFENEADEEEEEVNSAEELQDKSDDFQDEICEEKKTTETIVLIETTEDILEKEDISVEQVIAEEEKKEEESMQEVSAEDPDENLSQPDENSDIIELKEETPLIEKIDVIEELISEEPVAVSEELVAVSEELVAVSEEPVVISEEPEAVIAFEETEKSMLVSYYKVNDGNRDLNFTGKMFAGKKEGRGRLEFEDGTTIYDGDYYNDKKDGFGCVYSEGGVLAYSGFWANDVKNGAGVSFREKDKAMHITKWNRGKPSNFVTLFDKDANLKYAGKVIAGKKIGAGMQYLGEEDCFIVSKYNCDGTPKNEATLFDSQGNLVYTGGYINGKRNGYGVEFDEKGEVIYKGEFKNDEYSGGVLYKKI